LPLRRAWGCLAPPVASRNPLRRRVLIGLAAAGLIIGLVALFAALDLLRIRHDLQHGQQTLSALDFASVDEHGGITPVATSAADDLHRAAHRASSSPWLSVLSHVPIVGRQVRAVRDLTAAADRVGQFGKTTATNVQQALDEAATAGPSGRVHLVDSLSAEAGDLEHNLRTVDVGSGSWLLPPLSSARRDLVRHLDKAVSRLDDGQSTLATLRAFLVGPRRYLILGGNNAEMRSMGIATTSGVATIDNGTVQVGDFLESGLTAIRNPGVALPEGWDWMYGYLDPGSAYSNMVASPNFPLDADVAARVSSLNVHGPVDGVIYVDTVSLQALLSVVGPVTVDDITYDETNAARILINENYVRFSQPDQTSRRDAQGKVAKAIFDALNTRHVSLIKLAAKLQSLAKQRHLAAWSHNPAEEQLWTDVGADGARSPNDVLVSSQELGTSKLDFYVTEAITAHTVAEGDHRRVELSVSLTNPSGHPSSPYIDGGSMYALPGEYGFYLTVFLPQDAFDIVRNDPSWCCWAQDGVVQVTAFIAKAPEGTTRTINVSFALPADQTKINVVPSARLRPAVWSWDGQTFSDLVPRTMDLSVVPAGPPGPRAGWLVTGLLLFGAGAVLTGNAWGRPTSRQTRIDANLGWWLVAVGVAMVAAQIAIYFTAP
jgi:Protein of unknown function (DUF4012)